MNFEIGDRVTLPKPKLHNEENRMTIYIGIDPGVSGAIAVLAPNGVTFHDMPVLEVKKKQTLDYAGLACILRPFSGCGAFAAVELVGSMPGQGVSSMFSFGRSYGAVLATLATLEIPYELITPPVWKRTYHLIGCSKDESRSAALRLFPQCASDLKLKKHHGRADALLMAEYLKRQTVTTDVYPPGLHYLKNK